jgi:predicted dinucleotide-binding enzyme
MQIGVLGTGMVGSTLATKLIELGESVMIGSRAADSSGALAWQRAVGGKGRCGTFAESAAFGEIVFNCTNGANSMESLGTLSGDELHGKTLIDVANPLVFGAGGAPEMTVCNTDSLGEQIQRAFPDAQVVKVLNTVNCKVMIDPALIPGEHHLFICGNDAAAKRDVAGKLSRWFGWNPERIVDLGDITGARATEMFLALWLRLMGVLGTAQFSVRVVRAAPGS